MTPALIYTGGIFHPFDEAAPALGRILAAVGFQPRITSALTEWVSWMPASPRALLVPYALRWSMTQHEKYAPYRAEWATEVPETARRAIAAHVAAGAGLLGVHTASICFDDWPAWGEILGGAWVWGRSHHPPLGAVHASLDREHPLARGLPDFDLVDESYSALQLQAGVEVYGWSQYAGAEPGGAGRQPALWTHRYGQGRVVYDSLGHDVESLEHPVHSRLLQRAALWASGQPQSVVEAA
jgi:type 1 glutamine amidotransferase